MVLYSSYTHKITITVVTITAANTMKTVMTATTGAVTLLVFEALVSMHVCVRAGERKAIYSNMLACTHANITLLSTH